MDADYREKETLRALLLGIQAIARSIYQAQQVDSSSTKDRAQKNKRLEEALTTLCALIDVQSFNLHLSSEEIAKGTALQVAGKIYPLGEVHQQHVHPLTMNWLEEVIRRIDAELTDLEPFPAFNMGDYLSSSL